VGALADAWHPIGMRPPALLRPDEYRAMVEVIHAAARRAGRDPAAIELTLRVPLDLRSPRAKPPGGDRMLFSGTAAEVIADIRAYQRLGVRHLVFDLAPDDLRGCLDMLDRLVEEVRPRVARPPR
jgi:alkanesulfonate monooxygenase SsuD/methylene tetrahydromethanopterin reductase-like flavin-dependent oxidoreductase (luciferase family)